MAVSWEVTTSKVQEVIDRIVRFCEPRKVIVFGSYVRGEVGRNSDLDVLVVMRGEVENPRMESVRIRRALKGISMSMDILVVSENALEGLSRIPGLIYKEAVEGGEVLYESA